ncbi:hypothetical protein [Amphiplicatus metriothermophilus]|uniref:Lysylphosphatidylglycerol synthase TM region n=1 Tax=Amphiplicatus metriothermophilus TaxID=1519374 RepID=A0A239PJK1_9PROT|nr:hypothetical protein [Amphiplicatus metriothermophilus]MBB5517700.1 hypothetical protein [Amphiplicatus metriothermophilus]SNT67966.1 hypothetical protein SAMN06297382_0461 [Amphiplicatus metriothermophilus]
MLIGKARRLAARAGETLDRPAARRVLAAVKVVLLAAVVVWLVWRLSLIGWRQVLANLPASPWFYAFFAMKFLVLPLAETVVYQIIWRRPLIAHLPAFIRKRVYNAAVAGYSGEAFLTLWARRRLGLSDREALVGVKDNNILSAFTANAATACLIAALAASGRLGPVATAIPGGALLFGAAFAAAAGLCLAVLVFRRRLVSLAGDKAGAILGIHFLRQAAQITLYAAMYEAAVPAPTYGAWFAFIALQLVISRIPFLPNQELVYLGAALALASAAGAPQEAVAGMLVAEAGLSQMVNAALFLATAGLARRAAPSRRAMNADETEAQ